MYQKKFFNTRDLVLASIFIALSVVFTRVFSIQISPIQRIGFGQTPIMLAGIILGPIWGFLVGIVADLTGFFIAGRGGFNPAFTLIAGLIGLVPGLFSKYVFKNKMLLASTVAVVFNMLVINGVFTTYILSVFYGGTFYARFITRIPVQVVMSVLHSVVCSLILVGIRPVLFRKLPEKPISKKAETTS